MRLNPPMAGRNSMAEIFFSTLKLGLIAFGGPTAHLAYFREEYVHKRKWLSDAEYSDLLALSQFLPGPGSSQTIFALGLKRGGWLGGILASAGFTLPSALLMIGFAYGITRLGDVTDSGWLVGLKIAAVAVVAKALMEMARTLCTTILQRLIAIVACTALILLAHPLLQLGLIVAGGLVHGFTTRSDATRSSITPKGSHRIAIACLVTFAALLISLPIVSAWLHSAELSLFERFYRAGSAVFGGGHVVLPLLESAVVPGGHVSEDAFIAGYGAAQAIPGPLFTFSGYLGTLAWPSSPSVSGGVLCMLALFLPGWLLMAGALPYWERLRAIPAAKAALAGANAAVVGILAAALWNPVISNSITGLTEGLLAFSGLILLTRAKCPPWLWVLLAAAAGQGLLGH